jgi:hypothetical protein
MQIEPMTKMPKDGGGASWPIKGFDFTQCTPIALTD